MAPPRTQKRKSGPQTYESDNGFVANDSDTSHRPNKRSKTLTSGKRSTQFTPAGQVQVDTDGNQYWEISKMRKVTLSEFKGKTMVNIREYYEKDGKELPGKKGISMTVEQYSAFVEVMPQIEEALKKKGEAIPRPNYGASHADALDGDQEEPENQQDELDAEDMTRKAKNGKRTKANIEATSDEDEGD